MIYYLLALICWLGPYLLYWKRMGPADFDSAAVWAQVAVWWHQRGHYSVTWNPFFCGGYPLLGNPQLPLYSIATPLFLLFGPVIGLKLMVLIWMSAGFWLFRALAKEYGFSREHANLLAAAWVMNGYFVGHLGQMHAHFVCFFLVPGFYLLVRRWLDTRRMRYLAWLVPLMLVSGLDSYGFFAYFLISVPVFAALELWNRRLSWRDTLRLGVPLYAVLGLSLVLMGFYLVPVADYVRDFPRTTPKEYENPFKMLTYLFFPGQLLPEHRYKAWEFQVFIGPVLFGFLCAAIWRFRRLPRDWRPLLLCAVMHFLLTMGSFRTVHYPFPSPFDLLHDFVPGFSNVRVTSRFWIGAIPGILFAAGWAWREYGITRLGKALVIIPLGAFVVSNGYLMCSWARRVPNPKPPLVVDNDFTWVVVPNNSDQWDTLSSHKGIGNCYDSTPLPKENDDPFSGALITKLPTEVQWQRREWSLIHFASRRKLATQSEINVNMSYVPKWHIKTYSGVSPVFLSQPRQKIRLLVGPGAFDFDLVFEDSSQRKGWLVTGIAAALLVVLFGLLGGLGMYAF